jgi:hypothetical protein
MRRGRTVAFHALVAALTASACLAVATAYFVYRGVTLPRIGARLTGDWLMERDDEMGFVAPRHASTEIRYVGGGVGWHIFTDAQRARVDAPGVETPERVDVMTVGCSFTWGAGVENPETYAQRLGRMLGASVANFGMGSYGSVQAFQSLVRHADLKPKVVVYGFIQDHLRRNVSPCAPNYVPYCLPVSYLRREGNWITIAPPHMEYFSPEDNRAFNMEVALRPPTDPVAWFLGAKWAAKIAVFRYRNPRTIAIDDSPQTAAAGIEAMMRGMESESRAIGAKLVVLHVPYLPRGRVQPVSPALTAALANKDITFVDFGPVAAAYYARDPSGTLVLGPDDPHPNPLAHRMIADTLAPVVGGLVSAPSGTPAPHAGRSGR